MDELVLIAPLISVSKAENFHLSSFLPSTSSLLTFYTEINVSNSRHIYQPADLGSRYFSFFSLSSPQPSHGSAAFNLPSWPVLFSAEVTVYLSTACVSDTEQERHVRRVSSQTEILKCFHLVLIFFRALGCVAC